MSTGEKSERTWSLQTPEGLAGPYTLAHLSQLAHQGAVNKASLLRESTSNTWVRASQIPAIFEARLPIERPAKSSLAAKSNQPAPTSTSSLSNPSTATPSTATKPLSQHTNSPTGQVPPPIPKRNIAQSTPIQSTPTVIASVVAAVAVTGLLLVGLFQLNSNSGGKREYSTEELVTRTKKSVVTVTSPDRTGSGFVIADRIVATNYHVIADSDISEIEVYFPDGEPNLRGPFKAELVGELPGRDLALLRLGFSPPVLELDSKHDFRRGQDVVVIGSPVVLGGQDVLHNAVTRGVLSSETKLDGEEFYQLSIAINPGNSGGPVFGMDGRVIGVVTLKSNAEEAMGFCSPARDLAKLLADHSSSGYKPSPQVSPEHNARKVMREVSKSMRALTMVAFLKFESLTSEGEEQARAMIVKNFVPTENNLIDDLILENVTLSTELERLTLDQRLSAPLRTNIKSLLGTHDSLNTLFLDEGSSVGHLLDTLPNRWKQFREQLRRVDATLPLGLDLETE